MGKELGMMKLFRSWGRIISRSYVYRFIRKLVRRVFSFGVVFIFLLSLSPRINAVTPQQGWYIVAEGYYAGESYWIIAPKKDSTIGYTRLQGNLTRFTDAIIDSPFITSGGGSMDDNVVRWMYSSPAQLEFYSDIPWFIDADWRVWVCTNGITANYGSFIYFIDRSLLPTWSFQGENGLSVISNNPRLFPTSKSAMLMGGIPVSPNTYTLYTLSQYTESYLGFLPFYEMGQFARTFPSRININDLIVAVSPSALAMDNAGVGDHLPVSAIVELDVRFWCPKNKAPAACDVGMSWPYVPTATVNAIEHFDPWKEELQQLSQISSVSDIGNMNTRLSTAVDDAVQLDAAILPVIDELSVGVTSFPLFTLFVPALLGFVILCVLIRRAIN